MKLTRVEARRKFESFIQEYFYKEDLEDYNGYSLKLARKALNSLYDGNIKSKEFIKSAKGIKTKFYVANSHKDIDTKEAFLKKLSLRLKEQMPKIIIECKTPQQIYVEKIDSFEKVKRISQKEVKSEIDLPLNIYEKEVKDCFRKILGEPFHQADWGGEQNDLFTSTVILNENRVDTAFMLKGKSVKGEMYISDAGARGDQVQRLFESPAELFIVQFNGKMDDRFVKHVKEQAKVKGANYFCLIDGLDTARILEAYGHL